MKIFITGAAGQLGHDVSNELEKRGHLAIRSDCHHQCTDETAHL